MKTTLLGLSISIILFSLSLTVQAQLMMPSFTNDQAESMVNSAFANYPEMIAIAKCESGIRQYTSNGMPLRGGGGAQNIGIFQLNEPSHRDYALSIGYDIYTIEGNVGYAKNLFDRQGTKPWTSCLPNTVPNPAATSTPATQINPVTIIIPTTTSTSISPLSPITSSSTGITINLKFGTVHAQVINLQKILNAAGFAVATSGAGSPGNETTKFGSLTRDAVKKFQCAKAIVCEGDEGTTGYGYVGPKTRAALNAGIQ